VLCRAGAALQGRIERLWLVQGRHRDHMALRPFAGRSSTWPPRSSLAACFATARPLISSRLA
jgi:hypothetical protein